MKHGRANAHQPRRHQHGDVTRRQRQCYQTDQRDAHADRQKIRFVMFVAVQADPRLQQRCRECSGERNQSNLPEIQMKRVAQQRINRRQQRLHRVIQQMAKTDRQQNFKNSLRASIRGNFGGQRIQFGFTRHFVEAASKKVLVGPEKTPSKFIASTVESSGQRAAKREGWEEMVGSWGLEPQTSTVSRWRSNQLSYEPRRTLVYHGDAPPLLRTRSALGISPYQQRPRAEVESGHYD